MAAKPCPACDGRGKLRSDDGKPWPKPGTHPYNSPEMASIANGDTVPVICKECLGSGLAADKPEAKK